MRSTSMSHQPGGLMSLSCPLWLCWGTSPMGSSGPHLPLPCFLILFSCSFTQPGEKLIFFYSAWLNSFILIWVQNSHKNGCKILQKVGIILRCHAYVKHQAHSAPELVEHHTSFIPTWKKKEEDSEQLNVQGPGQHHWEGSAFSIFSINFNGDWGYRVSLQEEISVPSSLPNLR